MDLCWGAMVKSFRKPVMVVPAIVTCLLQGCGSSSTPATGHSEPAPNFTLAVSPATTSLTAGATTQPVSVNAAAIGSFTSAISVSLSGLPAGVTATPATFNVNPGSSQTITLGAAANAAAQTNATITATGVAGAITHTSTFGLAVKAAPAFTISAAPTAQTLTIGSPAGVQVAITENAINGFTDSVDVTFSTPPAGVTVNPASLKLAPGVPQNVTLAASYSAAAGTAALDVTAVDAGATPSLTSSAGLTLNIQAAPVADVVTYHYDNARDGLNAQESILTPAKVNAASFGLLGTYAADGKVDAAPLFAAQVPVGTGVTANVVYVATEHGSLYAYNAGSGSQVWMTSLLGQNETTAKNGCGQITPEVGITATPVIDRKAGPNGTIFAVSMSVDASGHYHQRLHALDLATGAEQAGSPAEITATYPGSGDNSSNGTVVFDPGQYAERAALTLVNGTIYTAWTSHCDIRPYTGWVMGLSEATLKQTQVLNLTPNGSEGSVWMAGDGLAADSANNLYLLDANGSFQDTTNPAGFPSDGDYGNGILKLATTGNLAVGDFFEPYNTVSESAADADLGSGGLLLLPDMLDAGGTMRHLLVGAGKDTNIYVADRDKLGRFNTATPDNSNLYQEIPGALVNGAWSSPAYFNNTVYYGGQGDVLKAFPVSQAKLAAVPSSRSAIAFPYPGTTPSVSANGTTNGIVWALESGTGAPAVLHAYDATNLGNELYNSNQPLPGGGSSGFGLGNKFLTPVVANGNVYVGTPNGVAVFGLLP